MKYRTKITAKKYGYSNKDRKLTAKLIFSTLKSTQQMPGVDVF